MNRRVIPLILLGIVALSGVYIVDETEQVIITQFGKPVGAAVTEAGIHFKLPFLQKVHRFEKRLLEWDGYPEEVPTLDKTFLFVDTTARWRISDPLLFFQTVRNERGAHTRLDDVLDSVVRNVITGYNLIETVRSKDRVADALSNLPDDVIVAPEFLVSLKAGREVLVADILAQAAPSVAAYGIELIDIRIKHLNYVESVRFKVYSRMISERERIAEKFKSEGRGEAAKILGDMEKELLIIQSDAYRRAEEIRGDADGESTTIYAEAYEADPEFYKFWRLLQVYEAMPGDNLTLLLTTDGAFYNLIQSGTVAPQSTP
ncbi:protease modulator HflC [bacterium]|nr:protease modulator HflC [bacterium]